MTEDEAQTPEQDAPGVDPSVTSSSPPTAPPPAASAAAATPSEAPDPGLPQSSLPEGYYTENGIPSFDAVAERISERIATADGNQVLDAESERGHDDADDFARLKDAGRDRLEQLRRSMGS